MKKAVFLGLAALAAFASFALTADRAWVEREVARLEGMIREGGIGGVVTSPITLSGVKDQNGDVGTVVFSFENATNAAVRVKSSTTPGLATGTTFVFSSSSGSVATYTNATNAACHTMTREVFDWGYSVKSDGATNIVQKVRFTANVQNLGELTAKPLVNGQHVYKGTIGGTAYTFAVEDAMIYDAEALALRGQN